MDIIAGGYSDKSKLRFKHETFFTNERTMQINLKFEDPIDVSLFNDEDIL